MGQVGHPAGAHLRHGYGVLQEGHRPSVTAVHAVDREQLDVVEGDALSLEERADRPPAEGLLQADRRVHRRGHPGTIDGVPPRVPVPHQPAGRSARGGDARGVRVKLAQEAGDERHAAGLAECVAVGAPLY